MSCVAVTAQPAMEWEISATANRKPSPAQWHAAPHYSHYTEEIIEFRSCENCVDIFMMYFFPSIFSLISFFSSVPFSVCVCVCNTNTSMTMKRNVCWRLLGWESVGYSWNGTAAISDVCAHVGTTHACVCSMLFTLHSLYLYVAMGWGRYR